MESYRCYRIWLWDSMATHNCDALTWLPMKITMPIANTADLILAGIMDIQQAIHQAPADLHIPPSHVAALKQLTEVLTSSSVLKDEAPNPKPHESLRVEEKQSSEISKPANPPSLRVEEAVPKESLDKKPYLKVHFAPVSSTTMQPTYKGTTGIQGNQRWRQHRQHST
jgi:hypothetical protein